MRHVMASRPSRRDPLSQSLPPPPPETTTPLTEHHPPLKSTYLTSFVARRRRQSPQRRHTKKEIGLARMLWWRRRRLPHTQIPSLNNPPPKTHRIRHPHPPFQRRPRSHLQPLGNRRTHPPDDLEKRYRFRRPTGVRVLGPSTRMGF